MSSVAQRRLFEFGPFRLDARGCILFRKEQVVPLSPKAARTLLLLVENAGQVVGKEEILQKVWPGAFVTESSLTRTVFDLRKALSGLDGDQQWIVTISKRGYRFAAPVREISESVRSPVPDRVMIAVLPFENLSKRRNQDYLADGLTEEMISQLGKTNPQQLGVIARTSAIQYRATQKSVQQIGQELGVDYIVEGSVRRDGGRVRITAQLIEVSDQSHLWSETYDRDLADILHLQCDVARSIAHEIKVKLVPEEQQRETSSRSIVPEAYELYLKGRNLWNQRTTEAVRKSLRYFERSVQIDPTYAAAYAGMADAYLSLQDPPHLSTFDAIAAAKRAAAQALKINNSLADAHISLGHAHMQEFDWRGAAAELERGLQLNPNYAVGHLYYSAYLATRERFEQAILEGHSAETLDPLSVSASAHTAWIYCFAARYDEAITHALSALEMDPRFIPAHQVLGRAYLEKKLPEKAIAVLKRAVTLIGSDANCQATLAHAYAVSGNRRQALRLLRELERASKQRYVPPFALSLIQVGLGNKDEAFRWLELAYSQRACALQFLNVNPSLAPLRSDRRFHNLLKRMDLAGEVILRSGAAVGTQAVAAL
jgi:TolB-like protein/Tfp pilus assembly protein PilF